MDIRAEHNIDVWKCKYTRIHNKTKERSKNR